MCILNRFITNNTYKYWRLFLGIYKPLTTCCSPVFNLFISIIQLFLFIAAASILGKVSSSSTELLFSVSRGWHNS